MRGDAQNRLTDWRLVPNRLVGFLPLLNSNSLQSQEVLGRKTRMQVRFTTGSDTGNHPHGQDFIMSW